MAPSFEEGGSGDRVRWVLCTGEPDACTRPTSYHLAGIMTSFHIQLNSVSMGDTEACFHSQSTRSRRCALISTIPLPLNDRRSTQSYQPRWACHPICCVAHASLATEHHALVNQRDRRPGSAVIRWCCRHAQESCWNRDPLLLPPLTGTQPTTGLCQRRRPRSPPR